MKSISIGIIILFSLEPLISSLHDETQDVASAASNFLGLTVKHGRGAEWHKVMTKDGYILSLFRIPPNPAFHKRTQNTRVIYLQHGLQAAADVFILFGPGRSLAYSLSDAGYDVWLGNLRGTRYSLEHRKYSTDDSEFWDFSMDEYALQDLPAMLDYIIETTGQRQLSYIGHSLGTTMILMLLADKPEYNSKLTVVVLLAPVAYWKDRNLTRFAAILYSLLLAMVVPEATRLPIGTSMTPDVLNFFCVENPLTAVFCRIPGKIMSKEIRLLPMEEEVHLLRYYLAGASGKVHKHYAQHMQSGNFTHYDYGTKSSNRRAYGRCRPPEYNVENVRVPMIIVRSLNDSISTELNIESLLEHLPKDSEIQYYTIQEVPFDHRDFVVAKNAQKKVYEPLLEILEMFH